MVTTRGDAKVMDFGLAKHDPADAVDRTAADTITAVSHEGEIVGTAAYMSPEQARGELLDPRSDLFSVGVLLYEMVSGQRPFQGASSAAISCGHSDPRAIAPRTIRPEYSARARADRLEAAEEAAGQPLSDREGSADRPADAEGRAGVSTQARADAAAARQHDAAWIRGGNGAPIATDRCAPSSSRGADAGSIAARRLAWCRGAARRGRGWVVRLADGQRSIGAERAVAQVAALAEAKRYAEAYDLAAAVESVRAGRPDDREPDAEDLRHGVGDDRAGRGGGLRETIHRRRAETAARVACWGRRR